MADENMMFKIKVEGEDDGADNECYVQYWYNSESDCNLKQEIKVEIESSLELCNDAKLDDFQIKSERVLISDVKCTNEFEVCGDEMTVPRDAKEANISDFQSLKSSSCSSNIPDTIPPTKDVKSPCLETLCRPCHVVLERTDSKTEAVPVDWRIKSQEVDISYVEFPNGTADLGDGTKTKQKIEEPVGSCFKSFQCFACSKNFIKKNILTKHVSNHCFKGKFPLCVIEKQFKCEQCQKLCSSRYQFKTHKLSHAGVKPYKCEVCNRGFMDKSNMKKHAILHTGEKPYACNICPQRYADKSCLNTHLRWHSGVKSHGCKLCDKKFFTASDLKGHALTHTGEKPFSCDICRQRFTEIATLRLHLPLHGSEMPFECKICDKKFKVKSYLRKHEKVHSIGKETAACEICKKIYLKRNLSVHMRVHTGVKLHECQECGKKLSSKGQVERHVWMHAGSKQFGCDMCPDRFVMKQTLTRHIHRHLGLKPYECLPCETKYETSRQLQDHIKFSQSHLINSEILT